MAVVPIPPLHSFVIFPTRGVQECGGKQKEGACVRACAYARAIAADVLAWVCVQFMCMRGAWWVRACSLRPSAASASVQRLVESMRSVWSVWSHHVRLCVVVGAVGEVDEVGVVGVVAGRCTVLRHQSIGIQWSAAVER